MMPQLLFASVRRGVSLQKKYVGVPFVGIMCVPSEFSSVFRFLCYCLGIKKGKTCFKPYDEEERR